MERPIIVPMPPVAEGCALPWDAPLADPVALSPRPEGHWATRLSLTAGRIAISSPSLPSAWPPSMRSPRSTASKGVADWRMLRRKLPDEIFVGRRTLPHQLFGREDVSRFLANVDRALDDTLRRAGVIGNQSMCSI